MLLLTLLALTSLGGKKAGKETASATLPNALKISLLDR
jgi:hypothetical protein